MRTLSPFRLSIITILLVLGTNASVFAQTSTHARYVPLIGITSVPDPLVLPKGPGNVTYHYAVRNFLIEEPLTNVQVVDDHCSPVAFVGGDSDGDGKLEYDEIWQYTCTAKVSTTTESTATATGVASGLLAQHEAWVTVDVGTPNLPPLVSIVNVTKVADPLSLPAEGGPITFTYKVTNPGMVPLAGVTITSDNCSPMSGELGDTNYNRLLDTNEVWIYTCTTVLKQTTTNTATVTAYANGVRSSANKAILTINVNTPGLPNVGEVPSLSPPLDLRNATWAFLSGILVMLIVFFFVARKNISERK